MAACPSCGKELPGDFAFCPFCGATLAEEPAVPVQEERKVVSVLFCDLVGFTSASDQADPEDVRARIRPYHARLRQEIERYGGTVEKFIGDAVMAAFGAPVAHEDDAERAVRAGLRILDAIAELNEDNPGLSLQVRVGIATGEAVVALGARPEQGEGIVTGDVVNTAARVQGAAPVDGIAVTEHTYRATERVFDYEQLDPVAVKGKAERLALFRPLRARARFGSDITRTHATPLVGRELEKPLLIGTFERSAQQRSCQLVTIVGEPGVGKSRLCAELFGYLEDRPGLVRWRQGRCLPYGDRIAFWALGEIVKAECGILESDSPEEADAKLAQALPADDPDRPWLKARLAPLVGAGHEPASQEESFTAWRRCLESWAEERETVLVFEDLHWADEALFSFLEYLAEWSPDVPLLLLCTARPELHEQRPTWAAGVRNATTINLPPLTDNETARLVSGLLNRAVLPAETQQALLERAGGNPLYAEEFVRLLADREQVAEGFGDVPESVQALIAARLDTLSTERKSLLQDAAVVGKVFWAEALADMSGRDAREVELTLHELARKELVRPARTSSIEAAHEHGFLHALVRDVCYAQIPRAARAARHRAAASWIERAAGARAEDLADVLAHHYVTALELARATGADGEVEELTSSARRFLALAGERAIPLDVARAEAALAKALELAPAGEPGRSRLLERWAEAALQQSRIEEARKSLEEALALYREQGETVAAGRVLTALTTVLQRLGDVRAEEVLAEALSLLEKQPPGAELVSAYSELAARRAIGSVYPETIVAAERALALAAELGLPEPARALGSLGYARCALGEQEGLDDMRRAIDLAVEQGQGRAAAVLHNNLALMLWQYHGPAAALERCREGLEFCERRGIAEVALSLAGTRITFLAESGRATEAVTVAASVAESMGAYIAASMEPQCVQLRLLAERGELRTAPDGVQRLAALARETGEPQQMINAFAAAARFLQAEGRPQEAHALLAELEQVPDARADPYYISRVSECVRCALAVGDPALAARLVDGIEPRTPISEHALLTCRAQLAEAAASHTEAAGLYAEAGRRWEEFGNPAERAYALLGQGRSLAELGEPEAETPLREARDLFASLGYKPAVAETEAQLVRGRRAAS